MPSFCSFELPLWTYVWPYKETKFFNEIPFKTKFIMLHKLGILYCAITSDFHKLGHMQHPQCTLLMFNIIFVD